LSCCCALSIKQIAAAAAACRQQLDGVARPDGNTVGQTDEWTLQDIYPACLVKPGSQIIRCVTAGEQWRNLVNWSGDWWGSHSAA